VLCLSGWLSCSNSSSSIASRLITLNGIIMRVCKEDNISLRS
jgi:hypothetical protein